MGVGVEMPVESARSGRTSDTTCGNRPIEIRLLGPLMLRRDGAALVLPASRKVRGLLAYLALAPHPVARSQLCELLWDVPNDPRGELRWCLSKIRGLIDQPGRRRVDTQADLVGLDLTDCFVDAVAIARAAQDMRSIPPARLRALAGLFAGDFLDGLEIDRSPVFSGWLTAQRRRLRGCHVALLEQLLEILPDDETPAYLDTWLELAPFDLRAHQRLLNRLAHRGQIREGDEHVAATARLFDADGLETEPLHDAWRAARAQRDARLHAIPATTSSAPPSPEPAGRGEPGLVAPRRGSLAVMPFSDPSATTGSGIAGALAHDVITRLAKLRSLVIIAQGTVFALHERRIGPRAGRPDAECRLRGQRFSPPPGRAAAGDGRTGRNADRAHRLG